MVASLRKLRLPSAIIAAALVATTLLSTSQGSTWTNLLADGDWNNGLNWGGGDFTGGPGAVPTQAGSVGVGVGAVPLTINQAGLTSLYMIVNNQVNITGGDLTYTGDGLWGSGIGGGSGGVGMATVNQTGGTLRQTGGGAGFLIGHNRPATYNISGGSIVVGPDGQSLIVDFFYPAVGSSSDPSVLNISGNGLVDVQAPRFALGPQATLNITGSGKLIWRNHTVADLAGTITFDGFPAPDNGPRPVIDPTAVFNARAIQVGPDVHLVPVPEPTGIFLAAIAALAVAAGSRRHTR